MRNIEKQVGEPLSENDRFAYGVVASVVLSGTLIAGAVFIDYLDKKSATKEVENARTELNRLAAEDGITLGPIDRIGRDGKSIVAHTVMVGNCIFNTSGFGEIPWKRGSESDLGPYSLTLAYNNSGTKFRTDAVKVVVNKASELMDTLPQLKC